MTVISILIATLFGGRFVELTQIFVAHDSGYFLNLATAWYPPRLAPVWHVFPLYPVMIKCANLFGVDLSTSAIVVATCCGLVSMPIFQTIVEHYFSKKHAITATLLYYMLPPVFVFSSVAYSESVFLLFTLLAWYSHIRERECGSCVAGAMSSLARANGVLIAIPLAYDYLRSHRFRELIFTAIPVLAVSAWLVYGYLLTGTWAYYESSIFWNSKNISIFRRSLIGALQGRSGSIEFIVTIGIKYLPITIAAVASLCILAFICYKSMKIDMALGIYSISYLAALILFGFPGTFGSFPRFVGVLFPIGLSLYTRRIWILVPAVIVLLALDYLAWWAFLRDGFI